MERLGRQLFLTMRATRARFEEHLAEAGGTLAQWAVLLNLAERPAVSQRELAELVGLGGSTITHHLDRLERDGLIARRRDRQDRRVVRVAMTAKGRRHLGRLERAADAADAELRSLLPQREAQSLHRTLQRLSDALDALLVDEAAS